MSEILMKTMEELEKEDEKLSDNYQDFLKEYTQYERELEESGFNESVKEEELYGKPYRCK